MHTENISLLYYPTTVAVIDDNLSYLSNIRLKLANSTATMLYQDAQIAIDELINTQPPRITLSKIQSLLDDYDLEQNKSKLIAINISDIYKQIYNPNRFALITTMLVDYSMPAMNGIEFCRALKNHFLRKIMLTGIADNSVAVEGFNQGILNKFLIKNTEDIFNKIKQAIAEEQHKFFYALSSSVLTNLKINNKPLPIFDRKYKELFFAQLAQTKACEYYMLDLSGSCLLLDINANPTFLLFKSDSELENYYQIAKDSEAPIKILDSLQTRQKLLFLCNNEDYQLSPSQWDKLLYPATKLQLETGEIYYVSISKGCINNLDLSNVVSYKSYLKSL